MNTKEMSALRSYKGFSKSSDLRLQEKIREKAVKIQLDFQAKMQSSQTRQTKHLKDSQWGEPSSKEITTTEETYPKQENFSSDDDDDDADYKDYIRYNHKNIEDDIDDEITMDEIPIDPDDEWQQNELDTFQECEIEIAKSDIKPINLVSLECDLREIVLQHDLGEHIVKDLLRALINHGIFVAKSKTELMACKSDTQFLNDGLTAVTNKLSMPAIKIEIDDPLGQPRSLNTHKYDEQLNLIDRLVSEVSEYQKTIKSFLKSNGDDSSTDAADVKNIIDDVSQDKELCVKLPVESVKELHELEEKCKDAVFRKQFIDRIRYFAPSKCRSYCGIGIARIMEDHVLRKFNWNGAQDRMNFSRLINLNHTMFIAWKSDHIPIYDEYKTSIRNQFTAARARRNKKAVRSCNS